MSDEAIATIKADTEVGLGLLNDPGDVDFLDAPLIELPARRIVRMVLEMLNERRGDPGRYVAYANLEGGWYPMDRLADRKGANPNGLV